MKQLFALELSELEIEMLHGILDSADRWIAEFNDWCNPDDFDPQYGSDLDSQSAAIMRLRDRLPRPQNSQ